ncbi:MAG: erythronate-4-phosphate dehydrogenase [Candidatus Kapaibacterium sp.]|nr:MAG: erythronate-4-phosphate dehydrogenase [Candidatus Kapabacteria bacterium]
MIFVDRTIPLLAQLLSSAGPVELFDHHQVDATMLARAGCTALFFRSTLRVTPALLEGTAVTFLGSVTSGSDHIAPEILANPQWTVALASGANANAVAEYVLTSVLLWCWHNHVDPADLTVGIIGFGNIGRRVAWYMHALGLRVVVNDPPLVESGFAFPPQVHVEPLDELLGTCTVITNHVPLTTTGQYPTRGLLCTQQLRRCPARLIVHTSRGGIIVERALHDAVRRGIAVAVDVWEREPNISPMLATRALLATPHIAGHSANAKTSAAISIARQYALWRQIRLELPSVAIPRRELFRADLAPSLVLKRLLEARCFDRDTDFLRRMAHRPPKQRCAAIEHFRATYPPRYEVFRTPYDQE